MMNLKNLILVVACASGMSVNAETYVKTDAYSWQDNSILQGEFKAYAPSATELKSDYKARPGFFMPISQSWKLKNDISSYPQLSSSNLLHQAVYNMALDEMVNAVEPDTTLRTGKEWAGVWTRDVSYSIILSMAYMQPEASRISLSKKVTKDGRIVQDTGSGGAWPVSSDRMIWAVAAYEVYKVTGDKEWLKFIYPIIKKSFEADEAITFSPDGAVRGETSFIDWREQSYPKWMQTADIYRSEAMGTSIVHAQAMKILSEIAATLGKKEEAKVYAAKSAAIADAINELFWMEDKGYYGMYLYGRDHLILNPRAETLGEALSILFDIASPERAKIISQSNPTTPFGPAIFYPQISDMPSYHNNALWPFVAAYWTLAQAKAGNENGVMQGIGSIFRPAALFCTNKENFNLDNGDIYTELNSSNMLWCLSGNIALTTKILFGINFEANQLTFKPFVPKVLNDKRTLTGFKYRKGILNITVEGYGNQIAEFYLNGKKQKNAIIPANIKGENEVRIVMANNELTPMKVNNVANAKAPLTPITRLCNDPSLNGNGIPVNNRLEWNPIEYIGKYIIIRDGKRIAETRETTFAATVPGEYQVIGVSGEGIESFASEPLNNTLSITYAMPNPVTELSSKEVSYQPQGAIYGFSGKGFMEVDHSTAPINVTVEVPTDGTYGITLRYANGNGPVNTENKCCIRTISIDGNIVGTVVMPHRGVGNWFDWGNTNVVEANLSAGSHTVTISMRDVDENMNIDTNHAAITTLTLHKITQ